MSRPFRISTFPTVISVIEVAMVGARKVITKIKSILSTEKACYELITDIFQL